MEFTKYLLEKGYAFRTCRRHTNIADDFKQWCEESELRLKDVDYTAMMSYVYHQKQLGNKTRTIKQKLTAITHYYDFLALGINPPRLVKLQAETAQSPHHLLTPQELDTVYKMYPTNGLMKRRDKVLLSLVCYQGVSSTELPKIEISDVDLIEGKIYISAIRTSNPRTLDLKPFQLLLFQDYMLKVRPLILQQTGKKSEKLLISSGQSQDQLGNVITRILVQLRPSFSKLKDFKQIRQSVITSWVKEHGVRKAQYMAGHRYVSSTERYNEQGRESLKRALKNAHPLS
jgi:integrase/recombinase XerD